MIIHLLRSPEVDPELFENVFEIVNKYQDPMKFTSCDSEIVFKEDEISTEVFDKGKFKKKRDNISEMSELMSPNLMYKSLEWRPNYPYSIEIVSWASIFNKCDLFRKRENIPDADRVILLTDFSNDQNWFSAWDPSCSNNSFIHTSQWEYFVPSDPRFPIAYEVMVSALQTLLFKDYQSAQKYFHKKPRGCVNDFCKDKNDIILKLRTADICAKCQELVNSKELDPRISAQVFRTLDDIRSQMLFRERFKTTQQPSRMEIKGRTKRIFFSDLGNAELKLNPLESIVYHLFLEHPEGLRFSEVSDHKEWLTQLYKEIGNPRTVPELHNSIEQLVNPTENSLSEKVSRIKKKIISLVGEDLAMYYIIDGPRDEKKKIRLDRALVREDLDWRENI